MADKFKSKLIEKKEIAKDTMSFKFTKPQDFSFVSGQTIDWTLINPKETDSEGNMRTFSIVAAPNEEFLMFATRMRDTAFKRNIKNFEEGAEIEGDGPYGSFTLHKNEKKPAVFLTGGIGITPVMSIAKDASYKKLNHKIFIFYSNHTKEEAAFFDDLEKISKENPNITFIPTMTKDEKWTGEKGRISLEMIKKYDKDIDNSIFYICGPANMVNALKETLINSNVDEDNIRSEDFPGY